MALAIKICGVTTLEDAWMVQDAGADALGLVFYKKSSRYVAPETVAQWAGRMPPLLTVVGLFVNASLEEIRRAEFLCGLDRIQLHGDEAPEFCQAVGPRAIKAARVAQADDLLGLNRYPARALLLDAKVDGAYGGTGHAFDWDILRRFEPDAPLILAGGLNPDNVAEAVRRVQPHGVDVSSGVEAAPGRKDAEKTRRFVENARAAAVAGA
ncbi:phosphoribosylanthranilate isomerase [Magnetofaba australis]|uniref:N-(5'-phosphoribosyl)anthranilate isomerase n=1 Tax=Magnetofaba australis IT-1 TaxID=1434232 RepID=A0A1Y2K9B1_9PROT|nr:phosphoribosylanthranilate isomerase [Magnetofaba australis]OSM05266.1 putative phosphoribosylanthranilate isomerase [Magnetofaba australis IT-1]